MIKESVSQNLTYNNSTRPYTGKNLNNYREFLL